MVPQASRHLLAFGQLLRSQGFLAPPDRGVLFLQATEALGPKSIQDIRRAARAVYGPGPEREKQFDALFNAHFLGHAIPVPDGEEMEEETDPNEDTGGPEEVLDPAEINDAGSEATRLEISGERNLQNLSVERALRQFLKKAPGRLPLRTTRRRVRSRSGDRLDMRRALRRAVRYNGEVLELSWQERKTSLRPIVVLIDVSGSMKEYTEAYFQFAHTLKRLPARVEIFTLGTELTRVTSALSINNKSQALSRASALVPDWDGGTRLGDVLSAFLSVPKYAGLVRGAFVITLSDGLERGSPDRLVTAVGTLSRLCWQHLWLTPLSAQQDYQPETEALRRIKPLVSGIGSGMSLEIVCRTLLNWTDQSLFVHTPRRTEYET